MSKAEKESQRICRVLSIQSHVVHGYVGNRSAVFPLQVLGFDVDVINSVQFSNHTWYKVFKGQVLNSENLKELFDGLKENGLLNYDYILTGYIGDRSFLLKVHDIIKELKTINPNIIYVCDPVMGDEGVMYVPENLVEVYKENILPLADVILPNQMEAEKLTGRVAANEIEALELMEMIQERGPKTVVLSSTNTSSQTTVVSYASMVHDGKTERLRCEFPRIDSMFIGTGDLLAALWLAWSSSHPTDLKSIFCKVQSTMQAVLRRTITLAQESAGAGNKPNWDQLELRLIQSKKDIESPSVCVTVKDI